MSLHLGRACRAVCGEPPDDIPPALPTTPDTARTARAVRQLARALAPLAARLEAATRPSHDETDPMTVLLGLAPAGVAS